MIRLFKTFTLLFFTVAFLGLESCDKEEGFIEEGIASNPFQEENDKMEKTVSLNEEETTIQLGDTLVLIPQFEEGRSPLKYYSWEVEGGGILDTEPSGDAEYALSVIGLQAGTAVIRFYSDDRLVETSCTLTVVDPFDDGIVRILMIGGESPRNELGDQLFHIAEAAGKKVIIGNLYLEGATLSDHWENASQDNKVYDFRWIDEKGKETNTPQTSIREGVSAEGWDYISLHQESSESGLPDSYGTSFTSLVDYIREKAENFKMKMVLHQNWAYQQGADIPGFDAYHSDQTTMYEAIVDAVSDVAAAASIDRIVPSGTAVQNGRATILGDHFTEDGQHLNVLGYYTVASTWFETLLGQNVVGNSFKPSGLAAKDIEIAQNVAHAAVEKPGSVTVLEAYAPVQGIQSAPVLIGFGSINLQNYPEWNAFSGDNQADAGNKIESLKDADRNQTGIPIEITKGFNGRNANGKRNVSIFGIDIPDDIAANSYYGNSREEWGGKIVEESRLRISKLDRNLAYDLCFYASRDGVGDNRETKYTCEGANKVTVTLNSSNNGSQTVCAEQVQPNSNGEIHITITVGDNNNNGTGFYYLTLMKISRAN